MTHLRNRFALAALALAVTATAALPVDYEGPAPVLKFQRKTAPALNGIDCPFAEQTARGAAVLARFPEFKLSDRWREPADNATPTPADFR